MPTAERYLKIRSIAQELGKEAEEKARTAVVQAEERVKETVRILSLAGFIALVVGLVTVREVTRGLQEGVNVLAASAPAKSWRPRPRWLPARPRRPRR